MTFARTSIINILTTNTNVESAKHQDARRCENVVKSLTSVMSNTIEFAQIAHIIRMNNQIDRYVIQRLQQRVCST